MSTHLLYALPAWASTCVSLVYTHKVKMLQNKVIRIMTKTSKCEPISPQYDNLKILKLDDLYHYERAQLMYQYVHKMLPTHFGNYFTNVFNVHTHSTRNYSSKAISIPRYSTTRSQKSFKYRYVGAKIWNEIPQLIKQLPFNKFKTEYKKFLLNKYLPIN